MLGEIEFVQKYMPPGNGDIYMPSDQKQLLLRGCQTLSDLGIFDEHGHLSARTKRDAKKILINSQSSPRSVSLNDFVEIDLADVDYPDEVPGETPIHTQIYNSRDDITAICHNHSPYAVTIASVGLKNQPVHPNGAIQEAPISIYDDYDSEGGMLITSDNEGRKLAKLLGNDVAIMLRGHGAVVTGKSIVDVIVSSIKLEFNSRMIYLQAQIGNPWYLPSDLLNIEVERVHSSSSLEKSIDYYLGN